MKKLTLILAITALSLFSATTAKAEYSFSVSFGDRDHLIYNRPCVYRTYYYTDRYYHPKKKHQKRPVVYVKTIGRMSVVDRYPTSRSRAAEETKERLGISDIIVLSKAGISDENIINKLADTGSVFNLTVEEVEALRREGVSSNVINYMLDTSR